MCGTISLWCLPMQPAFFLPGAPSEGSTGVPPSANFFMPSTASTGQVWMTDGSRVASTAIEFAANDSCLCVVVLKPDMGTTCMLQDLALVLFC